MTETLPRGTGISSMYLTVLIGQSVHAIPTIAIEEILPALPVEPISQLPAFVRGVVFVRGHLIPVLAGAERLGLPPGNQQREPKLVCLRVNDRLVGLEVDEAIDLIQLTDQPLLEMAELGGTSRCLTGVIDHDGQIIRILDPQKLLLREEEFQLEQLAAR